MGDYYVFKLKEERNQLSERLMTLIRHLDNNKAIMNTVERYLMADQIKAMRKYLRVLDARIEYTGSNRTTQDEDIPLYKERVRIGPYVSDEDAFSMGTRDYERFFVSFDNGYGANIIRYIALSGDIKYELKVVKILEDGSYLFCNDPIREYNCRYQSEEHIINVLQKIERYGND